MPPTVAIVGASTQRHKFGNRSVRAHQRCGWTVYAIHPTAPAIEGVPAYPLLSDVPVERFDRISVYVPPEVGLELLSDWAAKPATEIWLNPGAESAALVRRMRALGLPLVLGCSIRALGVDPYELD